jgi:hypothetical protein
MSVSVGAEVRVALPKLPDARRADLARRLGGAGEVAAAGFDLDVVAAGRGLQSDLTLSRACRNGNRRGVRYLQRAAATFKLILWTRGVELAA